MNFTLRKASRQQAKLKIWIFWPSWSWKTYWSLQLARWMVDEWSKIAIIDTENWSADLYSHLWDYNVLPLEAPFTPERYIEAINACVQAWMEVIIIDSISHEWEGKWWILELVEELSKWAKNSFWVWWKLTPRHNAFINTILQANAHIICCWRAKQDYVLNQKEKNWHTINVPEKVWLKAVTREWFDYEMTIAFDVMINHFASVSKDRTSLFKDRPEFKISEETWQEIMNWNLTGEKVKTPEELETELKDKQHKNYVWFYDALKLVKTPEELEAKKAEIKKYYMDKWINKDQMLELADLIKWIEDWYNEKKDAEDPTPKKVKIDNMKKDLEKLKNPTEEEVK